MVALGEVPREPNRGVLVIRRILEEVKLWRSTTTDVGFPSEHHISIETQVADILMLKAEIIVKNLNIRIWQQDNILTITYMFFLRTAVTHKK